MGFNPTKPMKWLPKDRQNPFFITVLSAAALLAIVYFGLIHSQDATLSSLANSRKSVVAKLQSMESTVKNANLIASQLAQTTAALTQAEADMASGDPYSWTYDTMRQFKQSYKVEIPQIGHPEISDVDMFLAFPYKQIRFSLTGTAYFHELGKFIADFENTFPHARVENLVMEPVGGDGEKLSFRIQIVELVKPNAS
jgi:Tfp pilus assembly protein PilO